MHSRQINAQINSINSYHKKAGIALPAELVEDLSKLPEIPQIPAPDMAALATAYIAAKDPFTDKAVQRQMFLINAQSNHLQEHLTVAIAEQRIQLYVKHSQLIMDGFRAVVEEEYPILKRAIDLGIDDLQTANVNGMDEDQLVALVAARKANTRIKQAATGWNSASKPRVVTMLENLAALLSEDVTFWDAIILRDSKADPFRIAQEGYALSLPVDLADLNRRNADRRERYETEQAKAVKVRKDHSVGWTPVR